MDRVFRVDFYPHEWLSLTSHMNPQQKGIFIDICALIYAKRGKIKNDPAHIGRISNCSPRLVRSVIEQLNEAGDIQVHDGFIEQKRCELELNKKRNHLESSSKGGSNKAEKERELNKNNELKPSEPNPTPPSSSPSPSPSLLKKEVVSDDTTSKETPNEYERKNGTRIETFLQRAGGEGINADYAEWCSTALGWDAARALAVWEVFKDYWRGVGGVRGCKRDWLATWRNWCKRKDDEIRAGKPNGGFSRAPSRDEQLEAAREKMRTQFAGIINPPQPAAADTV